jgi:hypothetical protein
VKAAATAQITFMAPPKIGFPTAAVPPRVPLTGLATPSPPPPPQAEISSATQVTVAASNTFSSIEAPRWIGFVQAHAVAHQFNFSVTTGFATQVSE